MTGPVRTLHVDIEGGFGGSSRSLFELIRRLDRARVAPFVAHRQMGPIVERYRAIGVPTAHVPEIGSYVPRARKGLRNLAASLPRLARLPRAANRLADLARDHAAEVIHLNYEGLFLLGPMLRRRTGLPVVAHARALLPEDAWGRWVARGVARLADHVFFISPREEARTRALAAPMMLAGEVLWNIASAPEGARQPASPPEALYLGSLDPAKGADRLIAIARALDALGAPPLAIAVHGEGRANPRFGARLRAEARGLGHRIAFRGHTAEPERALARALALLRPSREDDPWGRDCIEAARAGVPAIATGTFQGVIEHGVTGWLTQPFDAEAVARWLIALATDADLRARMGQEAETRGALRFGGAAQAERAMAVFERLAGRGRPQASERCSSSNPAR
jgi:glycosyltransferase involved in cell wall biosynthesis